MKLVGIVHEKHGSEEFKQFFNGPLFLDKQVVISNSKYASALSEFRTVVFMALFLQGEFCHSHCQSLSKIFYLHIGLCSFPDCKGRGGARGGLEGL